MRHRAAITLVALVLAASALASAAAAQTIAFSNVTVIPMDSDRALARRTVLVQEGRIAWIRHADSATVPRDAMLVDGHGRYLMPGLADMHVHLSRSRAELPTYLYWGVTTVLDLASRIDDQDSILALRAQLRGGTRVGPSLLLAGPSVDGDPPVNARFSEVVASVGAARRLVAERVRRGYDVIKVYNNVSGAVFAALVAEARNAGLAVVGHIPRTLGAQPAVAAGQVMVAHGEEFFFTYFGGPRSTRNLDMSWQPDTSRVDSLIQLLQKHGTWVTPNLSFIEMTRRQMLAFDSLMSDAEVRRLPDDVLSNWRGSDPRRRSDLAAFAWRDSVKYDLVMLLTRRMHETGVPLLLGTDAVAPGMLPGKSAHLELELLVRGGLSPYAALVTATRAPGEFALRHLRSTERFGVVAPGYRADLLLLDADPRADVRNAQRIVGVMTRGQWRARDQLQRMR